MPHASTIRFRYVMLAAALLLPGTSLSQRLLIGPSRGQISTSPFWPLAGDCRTRWHPLLVDAGAALWSRDLLTLGDASAAIRFGGSPSTGLACYACKYDLAEDLRPTALCLGVRALAFGSIPVELDGSFPVSRLRRSLLDLRALLLTVAGAASYMARWWIDLAPVKRRLAGIGSSEFYQLPEPMARDNPRGLGGYGVIVRLRGFIPMRQLAVIVPKGQGTCRRCASGLTSIGHDRRRRELCRHSRGNLTRPFCAISMPQRRARYSRMEFRPCCPTRCLRPLLARVPQ